MVIKIDASVFFRVGVFDNVILKLYIRRNKSPSSKHLGDCIDQVGGHPHFRYVRVASCR